MDEYDDCGICGAGIERYPGDPIWYHSRIEDFTHTPAPVAEL